MRNIALIIAYDGTSYCGWQRQKNAVSVQQTLEQALSRLFCERVSVQGAGRTDSGVHAAGACAAFMTDNPLPMQALCPALNRLLPADIRVLGACEMPPDFHPRKSPHHKTYVYSVALREPSLFAARYCHYEPQPLDTERMRRAAALLEGEHDFRNFSLSGSSAQTSVRRVDSVTLREAAANETGALWTQAPELLQIEVTAGGFLYKMVRLIAARLLQVGRGEAEPELIGELLTAADCRQIPPLPPQGLMLKQIEYDGYAEFFAKIYR